MHFILYSDIGEDSIREKLGRPEYSYYFVLTGFRPALEQLGTVELVRHPETEVDEIFDRCEAIGQACVFLCFAPPNKTPINLRCPTVIVFAWENSNIPTETWDDDLRNDWRVALAGYGRAITLCSTAAETVKAAMGEEFAVSAIATPVWDRFATLRNRFAQAIEAVDIELCIPGLVVDSPTLGLSADFLVPPLRPDEALPEMEASSLQELSSIDAMPVPNLALPLDIERIAEPHPAHTIFESSALAVALSPPLPVPTKTLRFRLGITKHYFIAWYREAIRDLLPDTVVSTISQVASAVSRVGQRTTAPFQIQQPSDVIKNEEPSAVIVEDLLKPDTTISDPCAQLSGTWLRLDGVIYTSVFGPTDGRKNWHDMVTAFCWAFRDTPDATLVLKMVHHDFDAYRDTLILILSQMSPFQCRVVAIQAFLEDEAYEQLIGATSYYVNTSLCEGLCLPLMEFMASATPAIAPRHTAMEDYIEPDAAFVIGSSRQYSVWSHDPRQMFRSERYRIDWESLLNAYRESYRVAKTEPGRHAAMGRAAADRIRHFAANDVIAAKLGAFFGLPVKADPSQRESRLAEAEAT